jgi:transaldolase/glucose-6-phosphate isomerase
MKNSLQALLDFGQSVWLDNLSRSLITSGELKRLIDEDGVRGLTSNPSIFEKAIADGRDYTDILEAPDSGDMSAKTLYEHMAARDIRDAADLFGPIYDESKRRDGYVSLEVSPKLAYDTSATLEEARRLWKTIARENLMIKVPGTPDGIRAARQLISEGINVNITLLFSQDVYETASSAFQSGLESFAKNGGDIAKVAGVASFFISRIDTAADEWIAQKILANHNPGEHAMLRSLLGKIAIASAKNVYQRFLEIHRRDRWQKLAKLGAMPQRLLWASTGAKNPRYRDVLYVEELIGPDTVNTMPTATLKAFLDHGRAKLALTENIEESISVMEFIKQIGMPISEITNTLLDNGVKQFDAAFDKLLNAAESGSLKRSPVAPDLGY